MALVVSVREVEAEVVEPLEHREVPLQGRPVHCSAPPVVDRPPVAAVVHQPPTDLEARLPDRPVEGVGVVRRGAVDVEAAAEYEPPADADVAVPGSPVQGVAAVAAACLAGLGRVHAELLHEVPTGLMGATEGDEVGRKG